MNVSAILLARSIWMVETNDLNPRGAVFFPPLLHGIVERFSFQKFPKTHEEMDEQKGVTFESGCSNGVNVERLQIFNTGVVLETRMSTEVSDKILEESLQWAAKEFGLSYQPGLIKRKQYVSQMTFNSDVPLLVLNPALKKLSDRVSRATSETAGEKVSYEPTAFHIQHDLLSRKYPIAGFTIQRRADTPFRENKYFSEAPLQTHLHETLLREFESDILATGK